MSAKNARPRQGFSPSLDKRPQGDPRSRQNIGAGVSVNDIAAPLVLNSQGRATVDATGPLVTRANGKLDLNFGAGLDVVTGSPKALVVRGSDSVVVNEHGVHSRPRTSQVRDDSGIGAGTLADTLKNKIELLERKGVAGGYAPLDSRNKIPATYGGVSLGVAPLDGNVQVPGINLGGASFAGVGTKVLTDTNPPTFGAVPAAALPAHAASHETGGSDALAHLSASILDSGTLPDARLSNTIVAGGPTGDATHTPTVTYDAHGRLTAVTSTLITGTVPAGHHVSHETGGSDALTALSAAILTTGTLPDARLSNTGITPGAYGAPSTGVYPGVTVDAHGRITAIQDNAINLSIAAVSGLGSGVATFLGTPTSANLAAALTDETGTGANVFATSPTLVTPLLGTPASGNATNMSHTGKVVAITSLTTGTGATFTPNAATTAMWVRIRGAGGGGGGAAQSPVMAAAGGGGGSGGYSEKFYTSVAASYLYSIATGGAGGLAGNNNGTAGSGATTFDNSGSIITVNQGSGGTGCAAGNVVAGVAGGNGAGVSTGGDVNAGGAPGGFSFIVSGLIAFSGVGGSCLEGGGGLSRSTEAAGAAGTGIGSGGSGACCLGTTARAGGAGKDGKILIWEFA